MISIKALIKKILPKKIYLQYISYRVRKYIIKKWIADDYPIPPPHVIKQKIVKEYANKHKIDVLVETGTYMGEMILAQIKNFKSIYSIEISPELHRKANELFVNQKKVECFLGDSSDILGSLLYDINKPVLFWLDGHYSEGITSKGKLNTPILKELELILDHRLAQKHVILIDDARCFDGTNDYPTINNIIDILKTKTNNYSLCLKYDIIRIELQ